MITCPCGMVIDEKSLLISWPPYRLFQTNKEGQIIYAICVHGVVVIDKLNGSEEK